MKRGLMVACFAAMLVAGRLADAAVINGQFVPDSLVNTPGAQYRIIFVTSGSIKAEDGNFGLYDNFLKTQVEGTMLDDTPAMYGWEAVLSTTDGLRTAGAIGTSSVKIYNTAGILVANNAADMLDGSLISAIQYDQNGTAVADGYAWTGSNRDGTAANVGGDFRVGSNYSPPTVRLGSASASDVKWIDLANVAIPGPPPYLARVYGISGVMTAVPEPSTIALWSICAGAVGLVAWRKRRKSS